MHILDIRLGGRRIGLATNNKMKREQRLRIVRIIQERHFGLEEKNQRSNILGIRQLQNTAKRIIKEPLSSDKTA